MVFGQEGISSNSYVFNDDLFSQDELFLTHLFSKNKMFVKSLEKPSIIALAHYPELKETRIKFKKAHLPYSMDARPSFFSIFKPARKRTYIIRVNDLLSNSSGFVADSLELSAQIGLLGHEYAHIAFYQSKSGIELIGVFLRYITRKSYKAKIERDTDTSAIKHGLGNELRAFSYNMHHIQNISKNYKKRLERYYLSTEEIETLLNINK